MSQATNLAPEPDKAPAILFLRQFLRYGSRVSSIVPSSRALATAACTPIDPSRPQVILELGAGTGAVTKVAAAKMHARSRLIAAEIDDAFVEHLRATCPTAEILHTDVREVDQKLRELGIDHVDVIINCLPTATLPFEVNRAVFDCISRVGRAATCVQITIVPLRYNRLYGRLFAEAKFKLVMANFPPGGVYLCRGLNPDYVRNLPNQKN